MESSSLTRILEGMRLPDGKPDISLRSSAIRHLLDSSILEPEEIQILQAYTNGISHRRDPLDKLPVELISNMLKYLDLEDFTIMIRVSKKWRLKLLDQYICAALLKLHFRKVWESEIVPLSEIDRKERLENIPSGFSDRCAKRAKRSRGKWHSVSCYRYPHLGWAASYSNGRVGTILDNYSIRVDNLRTQTTRHYMHEQRSLIDHCMLSNQLLLIYIDHPKPQFNIWTLEDGSAEADLDPIVVHLECPMLIFSAYNRQFVFGRKDPTAHSEEIVGDIYVWTDGYIKKLAKPESHEVPGVPGFPEINLEISLCGFVFHPTEENHYFVFYRQQNEEHGIHRLIIQEYIAGLPSKQWYRDLIFRRGLFQAKLTAKIIDDDGLVALVCENGGDMVSVSAESASPCHHEKVFLKSEVGKFCLKFTTFNVITKEFGVLVNHGNAFAGYLDIYSIWRGQIMTSYNYYDWDLPQHLKPSISNASYSDAQSDEVTVNEISKLGSDDPSFALVSASVCDSRIAWRTPDCMGVDHLSSEVHKATAAFCLPFGDGFRMEEDEHGGRLSSIWCDDDFIVAAHADGYVVWNFDPTVTLPTANATRTRMR